MCQPCALLNRSLRQLTLAKRRVFHKVLDLAFAKLERVLAKGVKESLRTACQDEILKACRDEYSKRLDQAPYKPKGMQLGTTPRVLALSNGMGDPSREFTSWAWVEEDGRCMEQGRALLCSYWGQCCSRCAGTPCW